MWFVELVLIIRAYHKSDEKILVKTFLIIDTNSERVFLAS